MKLVQYCIANIFITIILTIVFNVEIFCEPNRPNNIPRASVWEEKQKLWVFFEKKENGGEMHYFWNKKGQKKIEGDVKKVNGTLAGKFIYYYDDGKKLSEGYQVDYNRTGEWILWYQNGVKNAIVNYKLGEKNGKCIYYNKKGYKEQEGQHKNGNKDGLWSYFNPDGSKLGEAFFQDGQTQYTKVFFKNKLVEEKRYKDGKLIFDKKYD